MRESERDDLLALLYKGAVDPQAFGAAWKRLLEGLNATSGILWIEDAETGLSPVVLPPLSARDTALFSAYYARLDPYLLWTEAHPAFRGSIHGEDIIHPRAYAESELWRDFGRFTDCRPFHFLLAVSTVSPGATLKLGIHRQEREPTFTARDRHELDRMLRHLRGALRIRRTLDADRGQSHLLNAALDRMKKGVVILDGTLRAMAVNQAAVRLAAEAGLALGGVPALKALLPAEDARLRRLLSGVAGGGAGGVLGLSGPNGRRVLLEASRLPASMTVLAADRPGQPHHALVTLSSLGLPAMLGREHLMAAVGLTRAEADVALLLLKGRPVEAIATTRGTSGLTIRSQVRAILGKAGAANLRELTGLLTGLAPP